MTFYPIRPLIWLETQYHSGAHLAFKELSDGVILILASFCLSVWLQDGEVLFPAPQPNNVPVAAPTKQKGVQELEKERASAISPFRATLNTAGLYTGGKSQSGCPVCLPLPTGSLRVPRG